MTNKIVVLMLVFVTGILLGSIFYGGLWLTVKFSMESKLLPLWFIVSIALRTIIALAGFYFVSGGRFERLLLCLLGFIVSSFIIKSMIFIGKKSANQILEVDHAS